MYDNIRALDLMLIFSLNLRTFMGQTLSSVIPREHELCKRCHELGITDGEKWNVIFGYHKCWGLKCDFFFICEVYLNFPLKQRRFE
jgi:hypothetical protein